MTTPEAGNQPNEIDTLPSKEKMAEMSHSDLYNLRFKLKTKEAQNEVSQYEHRAFAREYTAENPVVGSIGLLAAIPTYQLAKATGLTGTDDTTSDPSVKQAVEGFKGIGEGLGQAIKKPWEQVWNNLRGAFEKTPATTTAVAEEAKKKPWEMAWKVQPSTQGGTPRTMKPNASEVQMAQEAKLSPAEEAVDAADNVTKGSVAELQREIKNAKTPEIKATLQEELARIDSILRKRK